MDLKIFENQSSFNILNQAPVAICIVTGTDYIVELANEKMLQFLGRDAGMIGHPIIQSLTEADKQGLIRILDNVRETGKPFHTTNFPAVILIEGIRENKYFDLIIKRDEGFQSGTANTRIFCVAHEVTEQVLALQELEEVTGHLNFRSALFEAQNDSTPDGVLIVDAKGKMLLHNQRFIDIWKMPQHIIDDKDDDAALKYAMTVLVDPDRFIKRVTYLYSKRTEKSYDQIAFKDGRIIERNGTAINAENGLYYGWAWYFRDITDRFKNEKELEKKVAERTAALEKQIEFTNSVLDASINGVMVLDAVRNEQGEVVDLIIVKINKAFTKLVGLDESIIGKSYHQYFPNSDKTGSGQIYKHVLETGEAVRKELYSEDLNLNAWFDSSVVKRGENGLVITFTNVSAQRKAAIAIEQAAYRLEAVFNASQSGMFTFAPVYDEKQEIVDFTFVITNKNFAAYVGQTPEVLNGEPGSKWFPGYLTNGVFDMYKKTFLTNETQRVNVHYNVDGHDIYLDLMSTKVGDEVLVTFTDYTPLKKAQLQLESSLEELKRSNTNLQEFAYAASHDLKEPVRKILFFSDVLQQAVSEKLSEKEQRYFERMGVAAKRMNSLIDNLLIYSKVNFKPDVSEQVDLNEVMKEVLEDLDLEIEQKKVKFNIDPLFTVYGHQRQLQQAFQNLIANAIKYTNPGIVPDIRITAGKIPGKNINLLIDVEDMSKTFYQISIKDNGIGFDQKEADHIFNVFTRLHTTDKFQGTGVGLSIVKKVIQNHKGYINAESTPGAGATFHVFIPAVDLNSDNS